MRYFLVDTLPNQLSSLDVCITRAGTYIVLILLLGSKPVALISSTVDLGSLVSSGIVFT